MNSTLQVCSQSRTLNQKKQIQQTNPESGKKAVPNVTKKLLKPRHENAT